MLELGGQALPSGRGHKDVVGFVGLVGGILVEDGGFLLLVGRGDGWVRWGRDWGGLFYLEIE